MSTKLTYTGAEVQELLDKIEKGDFDNAKTLEGHPASYFAIASEFTSLAESFATEQGRISALYSYFNNGSANNALKLGGQLPTYYATATQYEILQRTLSDFKSLFDSMFEKDSDGNIHAKLSLWSSGGITAGGVGSGGSGGGGGISYSRLDAWADYSADKAGYVLSAALGKDLDNRVSALANAGYITASYLAPYALRSEIPSLVGYATQSWVESKNYLTGITSSMVTTALGYTPYNSANFTKANIKSTLGISDWALASATPTIKKERLTNLDSGNPWTAFYTSFQPSNRPDGANYFTGFTLTNVDYQGQDDTYQIQLAISHTGTLHTRYRSRGSFKAWNTLAFTSDIPTKLSQFTDDVVAGKYLPLAGGTVNGSITASSFIGNLTGNADSASCLISYFFTRPTSANQTITGKGRLFKMLATSSMTDGKPDGDGHIIHSEWDITNGYDAQLFLPNNTFQGHHPQWRAHNGGSWGEWITMIDSDNISSFNAGSATKLATSRTIWGQSFDGTQDITGALTAPSITANSLTIGGATITYDSVNEALCINGNMYALGGITAGAAGISAYSSLEARVARLEQQLNI